MLRPQPPHRHHRSKIHRPPARANPFPRSLWSPRPHLRPRPPRGALRPTGLFFVRLLVCHDCLRWASVAATQPGKLIRRPFVDPPDPHYRVQEEPKEMMKESRLAMTLYVQYVMRLPLKSENKPCKNHPKSIKSYRCRDFTPRTGLNENSIPLT
jgi:hypothetical protein